MKTKTQLQQINRQRRDVSDSRWSAGMARAVCMVMLIIMGASVTPSFATSVVNGFGGGSVRVAVWCYPNKPPAAPDASAFDSTGRFTSGATASIPGTPPNGAPLPAACNPGTNITGTNIPLWDTVWKGAEVGGNKTAGDGVSLLMTLVPKYYSSSYSVDAMGSIVGPTHVLFTGSYYLSNSDAAFSIEWYSTNGGGIGSPQSSWSLLDSIPETLGAATGPINKLIYDPNATSNQYGIADDLVMEIDVAGTSTPSPEPGTLLMLGSGLVGVGAWVRRRLGIAG